MSEVNTNTTPHNGSLEIETVHVLDPDQLQRNGADCKTTLELYLKCQRNPQQHLGKRISLTHSKNYAADMQVLESLGYVRNAERNCFEFPQAPMPCPFKSELSTSVQIADDDPKFIDKMVWLESHGYQRNASLNSWENPEIKQHSPLIKKKYKKTAIKLSKVSIMFGSAICVLIGTLFGAFLKGL